MSDKPLILLGLDAGDMVLIEQWAAQGLLPTFAALLSSAASTRIRSTPSPTTTLSANEYCRLFAPQ